MDRSNLSTYLQMSTAAKDQHKLHLRLSTFQTVQSSIYSPETLLKSRWFRVIRINSRDTAITLDVVTDYLNGTYIFESRRSRFLRLHILQNCTGDRLSNFAAPKRSPVEPHLLHP